VPVVDASGARLWYDEAGRGPAVVLLHGGLGDSGLWEPVVPYLAESFRTIRTDLRFFGRSVGVAAPFSFEDDVIGVLDGLGIERAALVGLSLGGRIAIDVGLEHPERLWALAVVATGLSGHDGAALIASAAPSACHVELDSDHYVTLRNPEGLSRLLVDFLSEAARNV